MPDPQKNEVFLDVETKYLFDEVEGGKHELLGVSVLGIYSRRSDGFQAFEEAELVKVWPILEEADLVIGFNIKKFDYEVLKPYYRGDIFKLPTFDLLEAVQYNLGFRLRLDDLAKGTLGIGKTGTGLEAVQLYKTGKIEELKHYCLHDVRITRDLYDYGLKNGYLKYLELGNVLKEFKVSWIDKIAQKNDLQMSLGV